MRACRSLLGCAEHDPETYLLVGSKWRPPRRDDDRARARIAAGELLWDRRAVERSAARAARRIEVMSERLKSRSRARRG